MKSYYTKFKAFVSRWRQKEVYISRSLISKDVIVGKNTYIGKDCYITKTEIGNYCSIANRVAIGEGEHDLRKFSTNAIFYTNKYKELTKKEMIIEDDVWLGTGVIVLRGNRIGRGAVVGAGAVVTRNIEPYSINVGVPARKIGMRFDALTISLLEESQWWRHEPSKASEIFETIIKNKID